MCIIMKRVTQRGMGYGSLTTGPVETPVFQLHGPVQREETRENVEST